MPQQIDDQRTDAKPTWRNCALLTAIFAVIYGALLSTQWVAGTPDSEYYLAIARNLAAGMGFVWDGRPVLMVPPAWPFVLAGAMKISTSMFFLNLLPYLCSLAGIALWYCVLEKITTPRRAFAVMLVFGILFNYHRFAQHFYSEALFVPLLAGTLLLALRIRRGQVHPWHMAALLVLCSMLVLVRWAAIFFGPLIAAFCVSWQPWHRQKAALIVVALAALAMAGTFLAARKAMDVYARNYLMVRADAGLAVGIAPAAEAGWEADVGPKPADESPDLQWHARRTQFAVARARNWTKRLSECGHWLAGLYWPPAQSVQSMKALGSAANAIGWLMWVIVFVGTFPKIWRGELIWLGMLGLSAAMMLLAGVRGRYLTPAAPLLVLATFEGVDFLRHSRRSPVWRYTGLLTLFAGLGSIVACNAGIWAASAWTLHSNRFRQTWCGGDHDAIINIAEFLRQHGASDGQVAVSRYMSNFGRAATSYSSARLVHLLTCQTLQYAPLRFSQQPPNAEMSKWAEKHGIRYYVYRPPTNPWRLSHFRLAWLQEKLTGQPVTTWNPCFVLYELVGDQLREVVVPQTQTNITAVPGLPRPQAVQLPAGDAGDANPV